MPILKIKITNPQALELIRKIKSREILIPILAWIKKYRWYLISSAVVIVLITAMVIGKSLSEKTPIPYFPPPDIDDVVPTVETTVKSDFSELKLKIQKLNTDLPDPFLPVFENTINLEETVY